VGLSFLPEGQQTLNGCKGPTAKRMCIQQMKHCTDADEFCFGRMKWVVIWRWITLRFDHQHKGLLIDMVRRNCLTKNYHEKFFDTTIFYKLQYEILPTIS